MNVYTIDMKKEVSSKKTKNANELQKSATLKKVVTKKKVVRTSTPKVMSVNDWLHEPVILVPVVFVLLFGTLALWTSILPMEAPLNTKNHSGLVVKDEVYAKESGFFNRSRQYTIAIKYPQFGQSSSAFGAVRKYMMNDIADIVQRGMQLSNTSARVTIQGGYTTSSSYSSQFGEVFSIVLSVRTRAYDNLTGALMNDSVTTRSYNIDLDTNELIWLDDIKTLNQTSLTSLIRSELTATGSSNVASAIGYLNMTMASGYGKALPFTIQGERALIYLDSPLGGYAIKPTVISIPLDATIELPVAVEEPVVEEEAAETAPTTQKTAQ